MRPGQVIRAAQLLNRENVDYGKLYAVNPEGGYEEIRI